ncbi:MAG: gliding motility-associated C-terminal domain-containing protein [Crocinitomicaceae bacterium]|nr:gliding motility-associated C-terminal domain-containing protein [Crocinitomicaceae bacterium]
MKRIIILIAIIASTLSSLAQDEIWLRPNRGQWHQNISYRIQIPGGDMFLEKTGFTYDFNNLREIYDHAHHNGEDGDTHFEPKGHVVRTTFVGANPEPVFEELNQASHYENYLLGNDSTKWRSRIYPCGKVNYLSLYDGIDLSIYEAKSTLKYDILVSAGTDPSLFQVDYDGQDELFINENGELVVRTTLGDLVEGKPVAYQIVNGFKKKVACNYVLEDNRMHFEFPEGYDPNNDLVIDPYLAFSTFTGATSDNWGMTACPDVNKNMIAAGIVFGSGYPLSTGTYDASFNGGQLDIGITKFNATGTAIIFSTFLGGSGTETPHSIVVDISDQLHIMGATSSTDFPVGSTGYQTVHNGGPTVQVSNSLNFTGGADLFLVRLNGSGTTLTGGTYFGGSNTDGIAPVGNNLVFNYGDQIRGEIMVDNLGSVYICSTTRSADIPIQGGFQTSLSGVQDAIVAKFSSNMTTLHWSTYLGGSDLESGNSVQIASNGDVYVAGGTMSTNFPGVSSGLNSTYFGGMADGYVTRFAAPTYGSPTSTYLGTNDYDQAFFVQLDPDDFVYVYGQTRGSYPITPGHYNNPNSGQFIHKLSNNLSTNEWSSTFGSSSGNEELSPTAFLVSDCYHIYIAGWGGITNTAFLAANSSSSGMPITPDAYQPTTNGNNFYLAQFDQDMMNLMYSTYMGTLTGNGDHVDGGTSRFDKEGGVYHAVCAACGGNVNGFPTTPGVFSQTNNSSNCNLAAFLFELSKLEAIISAAQPVVCFPDPVNFINDSQNGNQYFWDFGDGQTSTAFQPSHAYQNPGNYLVTLIVTDLDGCFEPDTAYINVSVQTDQPQAGALSDTICPGDVVELWVNGGDTYSWGPANLLDDPSSATPVATITTETTFTVDITSICGNSQLDVTVSLHDTTHSISPNTAICAGDTTALFATGGGTYSWSPSASLDNPNSASPLASPTTTTDYTLNITTTDGCNIEATTQVWVDQDIPFPILEDEVFICKGASITLSISGGTSYQWTPNYNISSLTSSNPVIYPQVDTIYYVDAINACGITPDSVIVHVIVVEGEANPDTTVCNGNSAILWATGGVNYWWSPSAHLTGSTQATTVATPPTSTQYQVIIEDEHGCRDTQFTNVFLYPIPSIEVSPEVYAVLEDTIHIWAQGDGVISWGPDYNISCLDCTDPFVWPEYEYVYTATVTDVNGCTNWATVPIYFDPLVFIPNAFTPNGDAFNNYFKAEALNIKEFQMLIFNRWGELIKTLNSVDEKWDGSYNGTLVPDGVYVWQVRFVDLSDTPHIMRGHIVVLK